MHNERLSEMATKHYISAVCADNAINDLLASAREFTNHDLPHYTQCLTAAFDSVQPVFMRKRYSEFFWHCSTTVPGYLERVIATSSTGEAEGSEKLFALWQGIEGDQNTADQVLRHALDEARHSRMFLRMTASVFPDFLSTDEIATRESALPNVRALQSRCEPGSVAKIPADHVIDHLVQMNIGEIRTRLHMHLFAPILYNVTPAEHRKLVRSLLEALVHDELRHIGYTALLMEQWAHDGDAELIANLYASRLSIFNAITIEHTENAIKQHGQGRFPDLLEM